MHDTRRQRLGAGTAKGSATSEDGVVRVLRGRWFYPPDIEAVGACVEQHYSSGRTAISRAVCEALGWRQPNGWLKDRACRDALRQLDEQGVIALPPRMVAGGTPVGSRDDARGASPASPDVIVGPIGPIELQFAKGNRAELEWNVLMRSHHYLGYNVAVGRSIKYLVTSEGHTLGAIGFSSPAWRIDARDAVLALLGITPSEAQDLVVNNSRFLILPHVRVKNLASRVLSLATRRIVADWTDYYSVTPILAETFVLASRYRGTSYEAANWTRIGATRGYAKKGPTHHNSQEPKHIYLYGLSRSIRGALPRLVSQVARLRAEEPDERSARPTECP